MMTRFARFSRAPEFALSISFLGIMVAYLAAASALA
jgi:hypothetical protein